MNTFRRYSLRLLVAFFVIIYALWRLHRVNEDIRFTIATTTGPVSTPRNPSQIGYTFSLYGKQYKSAAAFASQHLRFLNGRYFVRVPRKSPGASEILWEDPAPDSLVAPESGWSEIPGSLPK